MGTRTIEVRVVGDSASLKKAFGQAGDSGSKLGSILGTAAKLGAAALVGLGAGAVVAGKKMIGMASDAAEVQSKMEVVFGKTLPGLTKEIDKFSQATGTSRFAMREQAADMGALLAPMLGSKQGAADMSLQFVKLATDLGSFNNIPTGEALEKIRAGLVGEAEPLRSLGVLLTAASTAEWAYTHGITERGKALTEVEKVEARAGQIMAQTALAQGDATRTAGSMANQMKMLKSNISDAATELGMKLIPFALKAVAAFNDNWPRIQEVAGQVFTAIGDGVAQLVAKLQSWGPQIRAIAETARSVLGGIGSVVQSSMGQAGAVAVLAAVVFVSAVTKMIEAYKALRVALAVSNPALTALTVAVGLLAGAFFHLATQGNLTSDALKAAKQALDALKGTATSARETQLSLAEAQNRVKQTALDVATAIKNKASIEASAGKESQAYKQAQNQVEAAYLARSRASLTLAAAEEKNTAAQRSASAAQQAAKSSVQELQTAYEKLTTATADTARGFTPLGEAAKAIDKARAGEHARSYARDMEDLAAKASKTAKALAESDPALSKMAAAIAKAATANRNFSLEVGKIPTEIDKIKGPAVASVSSMGASMAEQARIKGALAGANFATGMASGIALNASAAAIQAALMVNHAYSAASAAGQMHSPSLLMAGLGRDFVQGFILGITEKTPELKGKVTQAIVDALGAARDKVSSYQAVFATAFGNLGEHAKRAFEAKTQNILDNVAKKFDAQIGKWQAFAAALTPAEKALASLDAAEQKRAQDAAVAAAAEQMAKAQAMAEGAERDAAILAAMEAMRKAEMDITRAKLEEQAAVERAAREAQAATHIAALEATKARELQNLEERRNQLSAQLDAQLATLQERLSKHPEEYDKIQKKIQALLKSYGIPMQKSGELLGKAFAKGLDNAADEVAKSAKHLADIVAKYLKLKSPAEKGPLSTLDKWFKPMGPMLAKQMNGSALAGASAGMAGGAAMSPRMAAGGGGGVTGQPLVVQMTVDGRVIGEASYPHILVIDKRHGGRMLNHGAPALS